MAALSATGEERLPSFLEGLPLDTILIFYTIGRENPPHAGHIALHTKALELAEKMRIMGYQNVSCMFILGSGPSTGSTIHHPIPELLRSMDDPVSFDIKAAVLSDMLPRVGIPIIITEKHDEIAKLKKLATDMGQTGGREVRFIRVASTKEDITGGKVSDNVDKLKHMEKVLTVNPNLQGHVVGIPPNEAKGVVLSATRIRIDAYTSINSNTEGVFIDKYTSLYGLENAQKIYRGIKQCAEEKGWTSKQLRDYIGSNGKAVPEERIPPQTTPELIADVVQFMHSGGGGIGAFIEKYKDEYGTEVATIFYNVISAKKEKEFEKKKERKRKWRRCKWRRCRK